ncbi:hypothetical protein H4R34_001848 [Dimargaris verticillata]|uniref:SAP domain-containing protein n=1 Tax=Dimargaris verticillata TaxID=2761393 RepID=A0A9W8B3V3_9FUNG|nr:hypothetical protein H4R34_001848 [Dimargaris verticillata]
MPTSRTASAAQPATKTKTAYMPRATRTRAPKRVKRYEDAVGAFSEPAPVVSTRSSRGQHGAPKGHGVALRTFPEFAELVADSATHSDLLHALHRVLYNRPGSQRDLKTNLRAYHGMALDDLADVDLEAWYDWDALRSQEEDQGAKGTHSHAAFSPIVAGDDYQKIHAKLAKWTMAQLRQLSHSVNLPALKTKHQLVDALTRFLMKPGKANAAARPQKRATKPSTAAKGKKATATTKAKPKAHSAKERAATAEAPSARKRKRSADSSDEADAKKAKKQPTPEPQPRSGRKARAMNHGSIHTDGAKASKEKKEEKITATKPPLGVKLSSPTKPAFSDIEPAEIAAEEQPADHASQPGSPTADPQHLEGKIFSPYLPEETAGALSVSDVAPPATDGSPTPAAETGTPVLSATVEMVEDEEVMDKDRILAKAEAAAIESSLDATKPEQGSNPLATRTLPDSFASIYQDEPPLGFTNSPLANNLAHAFDATAAAAMDVDVTPIDEPMSLLPEQGATKDDEPESPHLTDGLVTPAAMAHTTPPLDATTTDTLLSEDAATTETEAIGGTGIAGLGAPDSVLMMESTVRTDTVEEVATYPSEIQEPLATLHHPPSVVANSTLRTGNVLIPESPVTEAASVTTTSTFPITTIRDNLRAMDDSRSESSVQVTMLESTNVDMGDDQRPMGQPSNRTYAPNSTPVITEPWSTPSPAAWPINLEASPKTTQAPPPAFPDLAASNPENLAATNPVVSQEPATHTGPGPNLDAEASPPIASRYQRSPSPLPSPPKSATIENGQMGINGSGRDGEALQFRVGHAPTPDFRVENKLKQTIHSLVQQASDPTVTAGDIRQRLFERLDAQYHTQAQSYLSQIDAWIDQALQAKVLIQDL